jgi:hypothetical protein
MIVCMHFARNRIIKMSSVCAANEAIASKCCAAMFPKLPVTLGRWPANKTTAEPESTTGTRVRLDLHPVVS